LGSQAGLRKRSTVGRLNVPALWADKARMNSQPSLRTGHRFFSQKHFEATGGM
jgi:hypothetical protein